jgi:RNA 3'-terminal phosphate cyclase (ATP)
MIEIDGSFGEGGGQILRSSLALAAVLSKEIRVFNIRAGRSEPGLKAQHLTGARAIAGLCGGSHRGLEIGSTEFVFKPGPIRGGSFRFDVGTAGSITLVLQAVMPLLPFSSREVSIEIRGGTDVKWSPPIDYVRLITLPLLSRMGVQVRISIEKRGHYPKGGGVARISSTPSNRLISTAGSGPGIAARIVGTSHSTRLPRQVAERQASAASSSIEKAGFPNPQINVEISDDNLSPGSGIVLCAELSNSAIIGGDALGEKGVAAEEVGRIAAERLLGEIQSGAFLDRHMGDMIVPYLALADGTSDLSVSEITQHTLTNVRVAEIVAGVQFGPVGELGKRGHLRVKGLGLRTGPERASSIEPHPIADS